jgi:hypothetical protein
MTPNPPDSHSSRIANRIWRQELMPLAKTVHPMRAGRPPITADTRPSPYTEDSSGAALLSAAWLPAGSWRGRRS